MPSHISHALLVEAVLAAVATGGAGPLQAPVRNAFVNMDAETRAIAILGAQGPDIFLHNHRRKPRAFRYGAILHRKGNDRILRSLARSGAEQAAKELPAATPAHEGAGKRRSGRIEKHLLELAVFTLGYITHVWMDRLVHPYVNFYAGWRGVPDNQPERPAMHAFLERIIDIQLLRYQRNESVREYRFLDRLPSADRDLSSLRREIAQALRISLKSAAGDQLLEERLANALYDSLRYYRRTESPEDSFFSIGRAREREGLIGTRWLSVVHPPEELLTVDALNLEHRRWQHPCDPGRTTSESVPELFERARVRSLELFSLWLKTVFPESATSRPPGTRQDHSSGATDGQDRQDMLHRLDTLEKMVGPENLNDGIDVDPPCRRGTCDPLPLIELYRRIKRTFDR